MARKQAAVGAATKRLNLALPDATYARIEELAELTEAANVTEVLRRSLTLYDHLVRAQRDGKQLIVRDGEHEQQLLVLT